MKIRAQDLLNISDEKRYEVDIVRMDTPDNIFLRRIEDVKGDITFYYDLEDRLAADVFLQGSMVCPCALTLEDVPVPFEIRDEDHVTFTVQEAGFYVRDGITLEELVLSVILPEVPIKVVKNDKIEYPRGDGWTFMSEKDYEESRSDPRLEILREYKYDEEEEE